MYTIIKLRNIPDHPGFKIGVVNYTQFILYTFGWHCKEHKRMVSSTERNYEPSMTWGRFKIGFLLLPTWWTCWREVVGSSVERTYFRLYQNVSIFHKTNMCRVFIRVEFVVICAINAEKKSIWFLFFKVIYVFICKTLPKKNEITFGKF